MRNVRNERYACAQGEAFLTGLLFLHPVDDSCVKSHLTAATKCTVWRIVRSPAL